MQFGEWDVEAFLNKVPWPLFISWLEYSEVEPFGDDALRSDLRAGIIASTIANVNRGKGQPTLRPIDFMPFAKKGKRVPITTEEQWEEFKGSLT